MRKALLCAAGLAIVALAFAPLGCSSAVTGTQFQVTPASLNFGEVIRSERLEISFFAGVEDQRWDITGAPAWLRVSPSSGTGNATVTVEPIRQNLRPDTYSTSLQIHGSADLVNIPVTMKVQ